MSVFISDEQRSNDEFNFIRPTSYWVVSRVFWLIKCDDEIKMDAYQILEKAKRTGKIEKGTNEVTKAIERGTAKFVAYAADVEPKEIIQHLAPLCKEKGIPYIEADSKQKLGVAIGLPVAASSVAVIEAGEAESDITSLK